MKKGKVHSYSNRLLYTLIAFGILMIVGVGVYASLGTTPNPGHPVSELQSCSDGEVLQMVSGAWACVTPSFSETDPKVGEVTNGKWCTGDGSAVQCNQDAPSGGDSTGAHVTFTSVVTSPSTSCQEMCSNGGHGNCAAAFHGDSGATANCNDHPTDNWFCTGCSSETLYCLCTS